jgi:hypothetical protein
MSNQAMSDVTTWKIGKILDILDKDAQRDAIHIAVIPVEAAMELSPGMHVGLDGLDRATPLVDTIGIVDPYLDDTVLPGERFFVFLYPGTITSLRHEWTHPAIKP